MLKVIVVPKPVRQFFHSLTHLLKALHKDGIWHLIFLSFILVQNEFDITPDYCGKKKAQSFIKIGKMALYVKVLPFCFTVKLVLFLKSFLPYFPIVVLNVGTIFPSRCALIWVSQICFRSQYLYSHQSATLLKIRHYAQQAAINYIESI